MFERNKLTNGMVVRSSDGDKLGKITQIDDKGLVIEKGIFFPKDYLVSFDQIDEISGDDLYLKWGTNLVEQNYDAHYGAGSYERETGDKNLWQDYRKDYGSEAPSQERAHMSVPLREEELKVERKGMKDAGKVRIVKTVHVEDKTFTVPLRREEVRIERVPTSGTSTTGKIESKTIEIPIRQEEVEISKRTVAKEAVKVSTESQTIQKPVHDQVRKEDVRIERDDLDSKLDRDLNKKKAI